MTLSPTDLARALDRPVPTAEQQAVIAAPVGPMLVVAGAGSGKTETIAARVVYLVANGFVEPGQVLGLTFTRKAAAELSDRIRTRLRCLAAAGVVDSDSWARSGETDPLVGTYHAFAGGLIDEFGPLAGIEPATRVLTATGAWQMAREIVSRWDKDLDTDHGPEQVTEDVLALSSSLADHLVTPDALDSELDRVLSAFSEAPPSAAQRGEVHSGLAGPLRSLSDRRALVPLVRAYTAAKRQARVVDFGDQMNLAATLVATSPRVGESLRERHPVVLLDEYQDTGHAQRIILRTIFGLPTVTDSGPAAEVPWRGHAVTAVGDPVQSIYGWRGASASNLTRFPRDFPQADGTAARTLPLLVSFRNARRVLRVANAISAPVRELPVAVSELRPRNGADEGVITSAVLPTVTDEDRWLAETVAAMWSDIEQPQSVAVLVRRRKAMSGIAAALRDVGLPVEIVGVGGLVDEPEVADIIAMLRLVVDHQAGPAALRILTGARWRLGLADIAALARRARQLRPPGAGAAPHDTASPHDTAAPADRMKVALAEALGGEDVDDAGLVDALADPGEAAEYSPEGARRIAALGAELRALRSRLPAPLPEIVADIERLLGLDVEVLLRPQQRSQLEAFAAVVADVAATGAGPVELLDYVATAGDREDGLTPGSVDPAPGRVQLLTVHAAKGLEWDVVALPHLCEGVFPGQKVSTWLGDAGHLPPSLRGDRDDTPAFALPGGDQGELAVAVADHRADWRARQHAEERRLFYVAVTRARHRLLLSAHQWTSTRKKPAGPGEFLRELSDAGLLDPPDVWAPPPAADEHNPILAHPVTGTWPVDPLADRRGAVEAGAAAVRAALRADSLDATGSNVDPDDPGGWRRDAHALLAQRAESARRVGVVDVPLPESVSVSALVEMADDPARLARRWHRPVPQAPAPQARRGTAFHRWIEHYFGGEALLDLDELPGAHDVGASSDDAVPELIEAFRASPWAARTPIAVEVPFVTRVGDMTVRGRIDAVFADPDGGATVVDWKTGALPGGDRARAVAVQLTAYRLAWSRLRRIPLESVRAAFYYVRAGTTVRPEDLMDAAGLENLVRRSTEFGPKSATGERAEPAPRS